MNIGKRIREIRKGNKQKLVNIAQLTGLSQPFLSEVERGLKDPSIETLDKICSALGITLADFFAEGSEIPPQIRQVINKVKKLPTQKVKVLNDVIDTWNNDLLLAEKAEKPNLYRVPSNPKLKQENKKDNTDISDIVLVAEAEGREKMRPASPELKAIVKDAIMESRQRRKMKKQEE